MKKLIPTLCMLLIAATLLGTSTYAWFSMNTKVTVTGMEVTAKVSSNLSIADDTVANTAKKADSAFSNTLKQEVIATLQPVSTIDGLNFFYTPKDNVNGDGSPITASYVAYDPEDTDDFEANSIAGAVGYVDYAFQLKAVNSSSTAQAINLTKLNLAYRGTDNLNGLNAFRVAIWAEKYDGTAFHAIDAATGAPTVVLMKNAAGNNFTDTKAAADKTDDSTDNATLEDVTYGSFSALTLAANKTEYFKIVIRLWLEGEDEKCNNSTFLNLTDNFGLDIAFAIADAGVACGNITNGAYTILKTNAVSSTSTAVNNVAAAYAVTGVTYNGAQVYASGTDLSATGVKLYVVAVPAEDETASEIDPVDVTANFTIQ